MRTIVAMLGLALVSVSVVYAQSFSLKSDETGEVYGPFDYKNGAKVTIGKSSFTLVKSASAKLGNGQPVWKADVADTSIPSAAARGMAHGVPFSVEKAYVQNGILHLRQGKDVFADQEFIIFLFLRQGASPDGKKVFMSVDNTAGPHVHLQYRAEGENIPGTETFMKEYAMHLEFGKSANGKVPGKIYLCLPDEAKSFVAGSFTAEIK